MQMNLARRFGLLTLVWGTALLWQTPVTSAHSADAARLSKLVSELYARYAWVAMFSITPPPNAAPLSKAKSAELQATFVPDLAKAIWDDAQCAEKRGEICTLDFDILFDSQDPSASDLTVKSDAHGSEAVACFKVVEGASKCLTFVGADVRGATRVADIVYPGQRSLRQLLGLKAKSYPKPPDATTSQ
jgi:hypothetical protein